ncbi:hypothetical protein FHX82_004307 [Amycolatopsis bartoniae]|uniref:Uncharacterized protein n=1 Tax=Amycolatopsis bartoniae TaxID=941986 RepID=A0A8H9J5H0_9PSEU|nr:hypothetical protein [Amycolatopsis bartoniae]MBB2937234.1 hypothetical protein [Amycolatopsis bartoniae]TVS98935.1 hypothetical protein FNH07_36335 [Amycolatopsis bartoniae]GHF77509.1 hypothetical protein GCM10017566_59660 [Amycolatopsis bartoniae]
MSTEELRAAPEERERPRRGRWWRGLTGSLAAGLAGLAVIVLGSGVVCALLGAPGPGLWLLVGHPVAAVLALVAQRFADRGEGRVAGVAGGVVVVLLLAALWLFWWG